MKKFNRHDGKIFLTGFLCAVIVVVLLGTVQSYMSGTAPTGTAAQQKTEKIYRMIKNNFLFDIDDEALSDGMYAGLLDGLDDQYSRYYTEEEYKEASEQTQGEYKGIGVVMLQDKETQEITIGHVYEGSPAEEAGVQKGDMLYEVEGETVTGLELSDVASSIRDSEAETVHLTLYRSTEESYIDVEVTKSTIEIPVVSSEMKEDDVAYIAIYQFTAGTAEQFESAYQGLLEQGAKRLIVDVRDNPGGLLSGVVDTLNVFMPEGLLVYTEDKSGNGDKYYSECKDPISIPLVVLVNENSASASEIFAGAVKDEGIGTLVGTTTFGKGIVQSMFPVGDGSYLKLTTSSYYTPSGTNIHGKGITPDIEVESEEDSDEDKQLEKAIEAVKEIG